MHEQNGHHLVLPLITVPIAAYKSRPSHLSDAIESALSQTWREIEVIVSDDSPDQSLRGVVNRFNDSRVRYRHNSPALGVARNHWKCFREAKGEFIAVLNHDDLFAPTFLERLAVPLVNDAGLALAFCDHWIIDAEGHRLAEETDKTSTRWGRSGLAEGAHRPFFNLVAQQTIPMVMGTVFRRSFLPNALPENVGPAYDLWLTYLLCRGGHGAHYVRERLSSWRTHPGNLTSQGGLDWSRGTAECWKTISRDAKLSSIQKVARHIAAIAYATCAVKSWSQGRRAQCVSYGLQSLRMRLSWKGLAVCFLPLAPKRLLGRG